MLVLRMQTRVKNKINISFSKVIKEIEINGNDRIPKETILMFADVKVGDDLTAGEINDILKNTK